MSKSTFALFFGNRGFFPATMIAEARETLPRVLNFLGHETLILEAEATRFGAVETPREGEVYANFLAQHRGEFDGVILCLPNFGDETGAVAALQEAGVPILIQAYPDRLDEMSPALRRDAFCGKLSVADVLRQYNVPYTALKPHVVDPTSAAFEANVEYFDRVCRVVKGLRRMTVGAVGARTTPFKTVRVDELALQHHGITVETLDMADVIGRIRSMNGTSSKAKAALLHQYADWTGVPDHAFENLAKLGVVLDEIITEYRLDALAIRCWLELQQQLGISPCVMLSVLNNQNFAAACEVDLGSAIALHALRLASGEPSTCLDWNNNYGDDEDKCILFHCGPVPDRLMAAPGRVVDHEILINAVGHGSSYGCNVGRIAQFPFTFGNLLTEQGEVRWYLGQGEFTADPVPDDFFGCAGVARIDHLEDVLLHMMQTGHRHHVNLTKGHLMAPVSEALTRYLGHQVVQPQH